MSIQRLIEHMERSGEAYPGCGDDVRELKHLIGIVNATPDATGDSGKSGRSVLGLNIGDRVRVKETGERGAITFFDGAGQVGVQVDGNEADTLYSTDEVEGE